MEQKSEQQLVGELAKVASRIASEVRVLATAVEGFAASIETASKEARKQRKAQAKKKNSA